MENATIDNPVTYEDVGGPKEEIQKVKTEKEIEETALPPYLQNLYFPDSSTNIAEASDTVLDWGRILHKNVRSEDGEDAGSIVSVK